MSLENVNEFKELLIAEQLKQMKDKHAREMAILDVQLQIKKAKLELLKKQISEPKWHLKARLWPVWHLSLAITEKAK